MSPKKFTNELFENICTELATSSRGLYLICQDHGVSAVSFYAWIKSDPELLNKYTRAREDQADYLADEIIAIADDGSNDTKIVKRGGETVEVENTEWTNRSKLRVEARKWVAAKLKPRKYGDKLDVTTQDQPINKITIEMISSPAPLSNSEKDVNVD